MWPVLVIQCNSEYEVLVSWDALFGVLRGIGDPGVHLIPWYLLEQAKPVLKLRAQPIIRRNALGPELQLEYRACLYRQCTVFEEGGDPCLTWDAFQCVCPDQWKDCRNFQKIVSSIVQ